MKLNAFLGLLMSGAYATDYHALLGHHEFDYEAFMHGFFQGAFDYDGMHHTEHCAEYSGDFEHNLVNTMRGFWTGTYPDATASINALGFTIADIALMLRDCGKIDHYDYEQVNKMSDSLLHPKSILLDGGQYIMVNGVNIYDDVRDGLISHRLGQFHESGQYWGHIGAQSLYRKNHLDIAEISFSFG